MSFHTVFIILLAAGFGIWLIFTILGQKRRAGNMARVARELGFTFKGRLDGEAGELFGPLRIFCLQGAGPVENAMSRKAPPCFIFDYEYAIIRDQDVCQTIAAFKTGHMEWPHIVIEARKRERFTVEAMRMVTKKIADWHYRYREIDMSSHPGFAKSYKLLSTETPEVVTPLLPRPLLDHLSRTPGWQVEFAGRTVLLFRHGKRIKPGHISAWYGDACRIFDSL